MMNWNRKTSMAFMPYPDAELQSAQQGPLLGLTFTVKDMFDVKGYPTSAGSPTMLAISGIKEQTAPAVQQLLDAGASFVGKVVTDELAFSVIGDNAHFGAPINGAAPDRYAGGSSSGSASSVSCGLCDFSLGTDSGGSVRGPASQCGLFGIRPSFGRISLQGCAGLCPPYDTAGILASSFDAFEKSTRVLIGKDPLQNTNDPQLLIPEDIYQLFGPEVISQTLPSLEVAEQLWGKAKRVNAAPFDLKIVLQAYQKLQGREVWKHYGNFVEQYRPCFGPGVKERFEFSYQMSLQDLTKEEEICQKTVQHLQQLLEENNILILPTLPGCGLKRNCSASEMANFRSKMSASFCLGGLAGLPWITLPFASFDNAPMGVSIVSRFNSDDWLLRQSQKFFNLFKEQAQGFSAK